jgi:hypothetical protein
MQSGAWRKHVDKKPKIQISLPIHFKFRTYLIFVMMSVKVMGTGDWKIMSWLS